MYEIHPAVDAPVIGVTAAVSIVPYLMADHWIRQRCPCNSNEVNGLDRPAIGNANTFLDTTSDITAGLAVGVPIVADWIDLGTSKELMEDMVVYAETLSINGALVSIAKYTVQRPLPRTYAGDPSLVHQPGGYRSFYSGHTSLTLASLSAASVTLNLRHHAGLWPWLLTAGLGASVAAERIAAGRHFFTDVAVGAVAGTAVGILVPMLHRRQESGEIAESKTHHYVSAHPVEGGAMLTWNLYF